ncbi:PTS sugar transporter subunit IIC [Peptoniphilus sp. KCTC 25270]|uniref:PTS transporter subunit IIC n=1 Tax=Peptoniphilus sp. KCTC 25270 TaxID=2897414 RepID=UPI001E2A4707|nr:PTS sugar transporter subunit IIC [Peptoniphilus sp. KCTC 25270]MCD1147929.1 PTS sugar transporter subunit IIC [Peptoniphilus sp. KCTC 25270]
MKAFLERKNIHVSAKTYFIDALGAMAYGLFASLLVGTILNTIGQQLGIAYLTDVVWPITQQATGAAIAVSIAYALQAPQLVLFASAVVGVGAYELGGPIGVYIATIFATELGKVVSKETKIDIVITPVVTVLVGMTISTFIGPYIQMLMTSIGELIMISTNQQPLIMGALVSTIVGIALTLPISSAAICMMLSLSGIAGGAATIGCCAQMVGFAVISFKDNGIQGLVAQGLGTSMLQMPNIVRNPKIWIPPTLASFLLGPLATVLYKMENTPLGSGMGTSGLVGQIGTFNAMVGKIPTGQLVFQIVLLQIVLPAILSYAIYFVMHKKHWIKDGDMKLSS